MPHLVNISDLPPSVSRSVEAHVGTESNLLKGFILIEREERWNQAWSTLGRPEVNLHHPTSSLRHFKYTPNTPDIPLL